MTPIEQWATAIKKHEGWFPGSRSHRNKNQGNFRCAKWLMEEFGAKGCEDNFIVFPTYEHGWKALVGFLTYAAEGKLRSYKPDMSLYDFYKVYAPSGDGNHPKGYAEAVAKDMGVSPHTKIASFLISIPMRYHRFGHADKLFVKEGEVVKKGQKIGTVGTGNGQYKGAAHVHYDRPKRELKPWTAFVFGLTKEEVRKAYLDSRDLEKIVFPQFHHYGWRYLEHATYGTKKCYHPGGDLNGLGAGDADRGLPLFSPCNGRVVYCYSGEGKNGGWGKLLVIEEEVKEEAASTLIETSTGPTTSSTAPKIEAVIVPSEPTTEIPLEPQKTTLPEVLDPETTITAVEENKPNTTQILQSLIRWLLDRFKQ